LKERIHEIGARGRYILPFLLPLPISQLSFCLLLQDGVFFLPLLLFPSFLIRVLARGLNNPPAGPTCPPSEETGPNYVLRRGIEYGLVGVGLSLGEPDIHD